MRGEDDRLGAVLLGDLVEFLDKDRALGLEALDDVAIVHDLVADIDRRAIGLQRQHDDLDGTVDAGAEAARAQRRMVSGERVMSAYSVMGSLLSPRPACSNRYLQMGIGEGDGKGQREERRQTLYQRGSAATRNIRR
jgi:hypothetical protein